MQNNMRYMKIVDYICRYYGVDDIENLLKSKENRYLVLLLLKSHDCLNFDDVMNRFNVKTTKSIKNNLKLAEEKLLINGYFREKYFKLEDNIKRELNQ